jgi:hypothetical protein
MGRSWEFRTTGRSLATPLLQHSISSLTQVAGSLQSGIVLFSKNGGVLVSTEGLRTGSHAEDDSLAS